MEILFQRKLINSVLAIALIVLTATCILIYIQLEGLINANNWVIHTYKVIYESNSLMIGMNNVKANVTEFLISGDKKYVTNIENDFNVLQKQINFIRQLTKDNPIQQQRLDQITTMMQRREQTIREIIANYTTTQHKQNLSMIELDKMRLQLADKITATIKVINQEELVLLNDRITIYNQNLKRNNATLVFALVLSEGLFIFSLIMLNYHLHAREKMEEERRRTEDLLRRNEEQFKIMVTGIKDYAIFMVDQAGNITSWNTGAENIHGYAPDEIIGKNFSMLYEFGESKKGMPAFALQQAIDQGQYTDEGWRLRKDGSQFWVGTLVTPIYDEKAKLLGFAMISRDLTEQRRIEQFRKEFVSVVSHELRTPVTSIKGSIELVLGEITGKIPEESRKLLSIADSNCDRLVSLINDILDIEKIESGEMTYQFEICDLSKLINEAISMNYMYAKKFDVKITQNILPDIRVVVDAGRLIQALTNLLSNAIKFSYKGGEVKINMSCSGPFVRVAVVDQGPGIPEEFKSKIFQKFSQADTASTRSKGGTGLGLAISKAIIEKFGGTFNFQSELQKGSTFYFDLPIMQ